MLTFVGPNDVELHSAYPELLERVDGGDGVLREEVVEEREGAEGVGDALEDARAELLDDVALQVERRQRVQVPERPRLHVPTIAF